LFSDSVIDRDTIQAYLETDYSVRGDSPLTLKIGAASTSLAVLHKAHGVESSAFITACNPLSQRFEDALNVERQAALAGELNFRSLAFVEGVGQHPANRWKGEPSFLVLGVSKEAAKALGVRYEQNAIVWCGPNAVPELLVLR
jgi:hypothetical protein